MEGEGWKNKGRIVLRKRRCPGIVSVLELQQVVFVRARMGLCALVLAASGRRISVFLARLARNGTSTGWLCWKEVMCVSDQEPLYKISVLNFLETDILQQQNLL